MISGEKVVKTADAVSGHEGVKLDFVRHEPHSPG